MSRRAKAKRLLLPWAALAGAGLGWFASQQVGSNFTFGGCFRSGPLPVLLICLAGLALAGLGAWLSLRIWRGGGEESDRFVAGVGMLAGLLFGFAILLQILAALILPRCLA
jgi:hypothetical protein